jgi:hypothetical protein
MGSLYSTGWAGDKFRKDDPVAQGWSALDLIFARPIVLHQQWLGLAFLLVHSSLLGPSILSPASPVLRHMRYVIQLKC